MSSKKILILSTISPNKNSGGPASLLWHCIEVFKENNNFVDIKIIDESSLSLFKGLTKLTRLGIFSRKLNLDCSNYDVIFICPFYLALNLDIKKEYRAKAFVLSVDSASFLFARFFKNSETLVSKIKNYFLLKWFLYRENEIINDYKSFFVVGKNDRLWLNLKLLQLDPSKVVYLTHPVLTEVIKFVNTENNSRQIYIKPGLKTLVFAGNLSRKYTGSLINEFTPYLKNIHETYKTVILVSGKSNKWVYDYFIQSGINQNIEYVEWVENYTDICNPNRHIHVAPLLNGAGTKNRSLTACALGVSLLTTKVGIENIHYYKPVNFVRASNNPNIMADHLEFLISKAEKFILIEDLIEFTNNINQVFSNTLVNTLDLQS
jgi:hypothetical protein